MILCSGDFLAASHDSLTVPELDRLLPEIRSLAWPGWRTVDRNHPPSVISNAWIKPGIAQIHHDIDEDEDDTVEKDQILHNDDVAFDYCRDESPAQSWHAEGLFNCHRAPQHEAHQNARQRYDGEERVWQGMTYHHQPLDHPLGARRPDIILADHFEEARTRHPSYVCSLSQAQHNSWADHQLKVHPGILPHMDH